MEFCEAMDPRQEMIHGKFGRESTLLKDGAYVKDLSYLNRPIHDIVYVDFSDEDVRFHKDNCIIIPKFEGDREDKQLLDLLPFLERKFKHIKIYFSDIILKIVDLAKPEVRDVRKEIKKWGRSTCSEKFNQA